MSWARKVDSNSAKLIELLRACGWHVEDTSRLPRFVDAVCAKGRRLELVEFKSPKGTLTKDQVKLHADFLSKGVVIKVVRDETDARRL